MGQFQETINTIKDQIKERTLAKEYAARSGDISARDLGIKRGELPEIVSRSVGSEVNCYPGIPGSVCHNKAFFISLKSPRYIQGNRGHLSFRQALELLVKHMQGTCSGKTRSAILLCDNWDARAFADWESNLQNIKQNSDLEIYLLAGDKISEIEI